MQIVKSVSLLAPTRTKRSFLLRMLQDAQEQLGYLPEETLKKIARELEIPIADVYSVATFYKSFTLVPKGQNIVTVCRGTACHVMGSARLVDELERWMGIKAGQTTTDRVFSLETVNCLGCCALGPVMVVNGQYHGAMTSSRAISFLKKFRKIKVVDP